jgi:hypothetical protein
MAKQYLVGSMPICYTNLYTSRFVNDNPVSGRLSFALWRWARTGRRCSTCREDWEFAMTTQPVFEEAVTRLASERGTTNMDDVVQPLRASKQHRRRCGLEVEEEWVKKDGTYGEFLRIAKAVEEARTEIDTRALQDLVDPEHKMTAADWLRFWEDRGFSGGSEPSEV